MDRIIRFAARTASYLDSDHGLYLASMTVIAAILIVLGLK